MAERVWVTGYRGFMGVHLVDLLESRGDTLLATYYRPTFHGPDRDRSAKVKVVECDIRDRGAVHSLLEDFRPQKIFHLAAQSLPTHSWRDPWYTIETNVLGTVNLFEGIRAAGIDCKVLNACSSAAYGYVSEDEVPVSEQHLLEPLHPYGVSKAAQEMLAYQYHQNYGLSPISVRIFNTTGPGKTNDVCSDLTRRLVEIEKGINRDKTLRTGNLTTRRAITDVRDVIRAFDLALSKATPGETYNLSGERVYRIQDIVDILRRSTDLDFDVRQDPALMRPTDEPIIFGNSEKFQRETGWTPEISLERTLADMLEHWRRTL